MCASYQIKSKLHILERVHGIQISEDPVEYTDRILPYRFAPVIVQQGARLVLKRMSFSLIPSWAPEPKVKFATHNARLDSIDTKPTWKRPFLKNHCIVPLTDFFEPIYEGEHAGHMVGFRRTDAGVMFAAAIWDQWVNKETGEILESFSIITSDPLPFVKDVGHDRTPVFIDKPTWAGWLSGEEKKAAELKALLTSGVEAMDLEVYRDRPMRPGWEKRK